MNNNIKSLLIIGGTIVSVVGGFVAGVGSIIDKVDDAKLRAAKLNDTVNNSVEE